jgi:hypothetical protein
MNERKLRKRPNMRAVTLRWPDGTPVKGGDLRRGKEYEYDVRAGIMKRPRRYRQSGSGT